MINWRLFLLLFITIVLVLVIILTWGSIGSAALLFCLVLMGSSLLHQHFLTNNEDNDFDMEQ